MKAMSDVTYIKLRPAEIQSNFDRVKWAEGLIRQLPENHDGRNSWLLNFAGEKHSSDKLTLPNEAQAAELTSLREENKASVGLGQRLALAEEIAASLHKQCEAKDAEIERLRKALDNLLKHIDRIEYRDKAGLRLSDVVPQVEHVRAALAAYVGEGKRLK
jgi:hypothetical protein